MKRLFLTASIIADIADVANIANVIADNFADIKIIVEYLNNYFRLHVCLSFRTYVRPYVTLSFFSISCSCFTKCHL